MDNNKILHGDCIDFMKKISDNTINMVLTDIPYDMVNRESNGLRNLDKGKADIITFNLQSFLENCFRVCSGTIVIFCGINQVSKIYNYFAEKQKHHKGTVRQIIWKKTNPSPMNGQHIYLSGIENAIWFKKRGGTFNAQCKNTVFEFACGRSKLHPTEKNHELLRELIKDNSNENDIILDPCCGSGSHIMVALQENRRGVGIELNQEYIKIAQKRLKPFLNQTSLGVPHYKGFI